MGVLVCYDDFSYDVVSDLHLEYLLEKGCIIGYDNSGEWVKEPVQEPAPSPHPGEPAPARRTSSAPSSKERERPRGHSRRP